MEKTILGPITIKGDKDTKASDILKNSFYDAISKIKLNIPFKADGFKPEKIPNQPDGTPIVVEPANIEQDKLKRENSKEELEEKLVPKKYTKEYLETLSLKELKVIGKEFGTTDRSKANLIKEILKLQK